MNCPVCKANLEFPVADLDEVYYDCSACNSSLLFKNGECEILSEGQAKASSTQNQKEDTGQSSQDLLEEEKPSPSEETSEEIVEEENPVETKEDLQTSDEEFSEITEVPELTSPEEKLDEIFEQEEEPISTTAPETAEEEVLDQTFEESEQAEAQEEPVENQKLSQTADSEESKEDFSDVAQFGNSQNQDEQGPFLYDLILSEINSQDVREEVLNVLEDEALNLPVGEEDQFIENSIKDGKIIIEKISPVQTYVIVTSLMGLALDISWKQHHIADS